MRSQNYKNRLLSSSCLSVRPHGITRLPQDGFSLNLIFVVFFRKSVEKIQVSLKSDNNNRYFTWRPIYIFNNISLNSSRNTKCLRQNLRKKIGTNNLYSIIFFFFFEKKIRSCRRILHSRTGDRWPYGACTLQAEHISLQTHTQNK